MTGAGAGSRVIQFKGRVFCGRQSDGPLGLVLTGVSQDRPNEAVQVAFSCAAPADLPAELVDAKLEFCGAGRHRLTEEALNRRAAEKKTEKETAAGRRSWELHGPVHVHREVLTAFYQAIPPRVVPFRKRLFWRVMLGLAANPLARRLLLRGR
jgi:hypothetical protein